MTEVDAREPAQQDDSPNSADAGETDPDDETPTGEHDDGQDDADDGDQLGNEAKRYRLRLREVERERDELRDTLERTRQAIVANAMRAAGLDGRLFAAAGHTVDTMVRDDGLIDHDALAEAITNTAREFNIKRPGKLIPNPQQGSGSGGQPRGETSWSKALNDATKR